MQHETGGRQDDHFAGVGAAGGREIDDKAGEGEKEHCLGSVKIYWKSLLDLKGAKSTARKTNENYPRHSNINGRST